MLFAKSRYTPSGAIVVPSNSYTIEGLDIVSTAGHAIEGLNKTGLIIRKCRIRHKGGRGITLNGCAGAIIEDCQVIYDGAAATPYPASGPAPSETDNAIRIINSDDVQITRNQTNNGNGLFVDTSARVAVRYFHMVNTRGLDRLGYGSGIGFSNSTNCSLLDFYVQNDMQLAWTGDGVNCSGGSGHTIARGVIDGNNCYAGACIQLQGCSATKATDVDAINWVQQAFCTFAGVSNTFDTCRAKQVLFPNTQGREPSAAGGAGVAFAQLSGTTGTRWHDCTEYVFSPDNSYYADGGTTTVEETFSHANFTQRAAYTWSPAYV